MSQEYSLALTLSSEEAEGFVPSTPVPLLPLHRHPQPILHSGCRCDSVGSLVIVSGGGVGEVRNEAMCV